MAESRNDPSDEELVRRFRAGDETAMRRLFERHADELRARVARNLPRAMRPRVAASDVVQEAWLAAFLRLEGFEDRGDGSFRRWLGTIVENKVLDEVRHHVGAGKRDVRREIDVQSGIVRLAGSARERSASADLRDAEDRAQVERAMSALPEAQREVMRLAHEERLTMEQAAARMGRSLAAVRKLYARAVLRLAQEVGGASAG
jgi:RNA polymerase sigma-70 factor (ECF subfamily)